MTVVEKAIGVKHLLVVMMILLVCFSSAAAQDLQECNPQLPTRLAYGLAGIVTITDDPTPVRVRAEPSTQSEVVGQIPEGGRFVVAIFEPTCADGIAWWLVTTEDAGSAEPLTAWIAEGAGDTYFVQPFDAALALPVGAVPTASAPPQRTTYDFDLPAVDIDRTPPDVDAAFATWRWPVESYVLQSLSVPDPAALVLPSTYGGDMPQLPIDLNQVAYLEDAGLSAAQLETLARNGFVVVPGDAEFFERASWRDPATGRSDFISTDLLLHNLYLTYRYSLMYLESGVFFNQLSRIAIDGYRAAEAQYLAAKGTSLEGPARSAAAYYAVLLLVLSDAAEAVGTSAQPDFNNPDSLTAAFYAQFITDYPWEYVSLIDADVLAEAQPTADLVRQGDGIATVPLLEDYSEDFGLYRPRSHYTNDALLSAYFRALIWLGRITFRADSEQDTQTAQLITRALFDTTTVDSNAYTSWAALHDTLSFLVGPSDNLTPRDYQALMVEVYGEDLALDTLNDTNRLQEFRSRLRDLPPPRINGLLMPQGTGEGEMLEANRGFRLLGSRFTLDALYFQQLMDPSIPGRALPGGVDLAAAFGSDEAYSLADAAGAASFAEYPPAMAALRQQTNDLTSADWLETAYGGWLYALQPLVVRDPALAPPLMTTDAWHRHELTTMLASWAALKNATAAYVSLPAGLGGGGDTPPLTTYTTVEHNPQAFARIAIVSALLANGLEEKGFTEGPLTAVIQSAQTNAALAALCAEVARLEIAGEPIPEDYLFFLQQTFMVASGYVRITLQQFDGNPQPNTAVTAITANSPAGYLQVGTGPVDYIYVVSDRPEGLQLVRGGVYSYYEYVNTSGQPLSDEEWRAALADGSAPLRPEWTSAYYIP